MSNKAVFGLVIAAGLVASILAAPVLASALTDFLNIYSARVYVNPDTDRLWATLPTGGKIPTDGSAGAFGYGILTKDGNAILVSTSHAGVLDSEDQRFIMDPVFHNHLVTLGKVDRCGINPGVVDITWQSPGRVLIDENQARIAGIPTSEIHATHSITGEHLKMKLGEEVSGAVSFKLMPIFGDTGLKAVCVKDIKPAKNLEVIIVE
jgi:hypothetical protein